MPNTANIAGLEIRKTGHSGFIVKGTSTKIAFDPYKINIKETVDVIFISHSHYDHCSPQDIEKLASPSALIVTTPDCQSKVSHLKVANVISVEPNKEYDVNGLKVKTIPAYNIGKSFHLKESELVGYIVQIGGKNIYHAGDTDATPEMKALKNIDIAFVPVSGTYVMTAEEAAAAVNAFKPKFAIPMHYGAGVAGTRKDAEKFKSLVTGAEVVLLD